MADYSYGGGEIEDPELRKLNAEVLANPDEFEGWEKLVRAAETLDGGLNRNSNPQSISAARDVYDRFLAKFPLFFGYWKKYADLEFAIAGTEAAEMVYERGVGSISSSVDLWTNYCSFKVDTSHDADVIRELFERGADSVGLDFLAHPFWDKYVEFEERLEQRDRIFAIYARVIHIPLHQYARYFERYRQLCASQSVEQLAPNEILNSCRIEAMQELQLHGGSGADLERLLREKIDQYYLNIFHNVQNETTKRWTYEQEIKRPYFHVTDLDDGQLSNWHKYLDFEENEGQLKRIVFLYERCLASAARYDEFWQRYVHFMYAQPGKDEEVRNIFQRASCIFTPIARPAIRIQWAMFEESCDRPNVAGEIYEAILMVLPDHLETIIAQANLQRRQQGITAATRVYQTYIQSGDCSAQTKGILVAELARLARQTTDDAEAGRNVFQSQKNTLSNSNTYWDGYLDYEIQQPAPESIAAAQHQRVKSVHNEIRKQRKLGPDAIKELSTKYLKYLSQHGDQSAVKDYLDLDAEINGPASIPAALQHKARFLPAAAAMQPFKNGVPLQNHK